MLKKRNVPSSNTWVNGPPKLRQFWPWSNNEMKKPEPPNLSQLLERVKNLKARKLGSFQLDTDDYVYLVRIGAHRGHPWDIDHAIEVLELKIITKRLSA
jgi:hypothetical protein